jgi:cell division protein FtsW (lipid II flippase)
MSFMVMLYISTGNAFMFFGGMASFSAASVVAYNMFAHVRVRVLAWSDPWSHINLEGYQITQSLFAIGTYGFIGIGLTRVIAINIPDVQTDFIFAAICEEFGGIFAIGLIGVYIMIFYRGSHIALRCEKRYYSLLAAGFTSMLAFQTFVILGGVTKFIPMTGVTLPFISYGGSSIVVSILMMGILQWVYMYNEDGE